MTVGEHMMNIKRISCYKCAGRMFFNENNKYWECPECDVNISEELMKLYHTGLKFGQSQSNQVIVGLRDQLKRLTIRNKRLLDMNKSAKLQQLIKIATISAADAKRIINEDYNRHQYDKKNMPTPKDIDEYSLWTGAKIKKDTSGTQVKYFIISYTSDGQDVIDILTWLHNV